jgi:hypothetical protein
MAKKRIKADKRVSTDPKIFFYVIDTEGYASGSLEYIYHLAKFAKDAGYDVTMLYQANNNKDDEKFVGVEGWLGKEYASLPHVNINEKELEVGVYDILFIPEIFSQVMNQTKKLPCKRIAIMQNYDYILSQTPYSAQWGDYGILDALCNTEENEKLLKSIFPYVKTHVVEPFVSDKFGITNTPKKLYVNVVSKNKDDITRLVKPFYWKYPLMRWVSFKDLSGMSKEVFSKMLREGFLTVWMDRDASFGYSPIEAMKSGNIVIAQIPDVWKKWMLDEEGKNLNDSCIWFESLKDDMLHVKIAQLVRAFLTDSIPEILYEGQKRVKDMYKEDETKNNFLEYLGNQVSLRKEAVENAIKEKEGKNDVKK